MSNKKTKLNKVIDNPGILSDGKITVEENKQTTEDWIPGENIPRYVVVRDGLRVSDKEYPTINDPKAISRKRR